MVNLHFLSLLEALLECRTVTLCKLIPMWKEVLFTDKNIKVRLNQFSKIQKNNTISNILYGETIEKKIARKTIHINCITIHTLNSVTKKDS